MCSGGNSKVAEGVFCVGRDTHIPTMERSESIGIAVGIAIGVPVGVMLDNVTAGIAIGLALGIAGGLIAKQ